MGARCLAALLVAAATPAVAATVQLPAPATESWRPLALPGVARPTDYAARRDGDRLAVRAHSRCSASALVLPLEGVDLDRTPRLRWWWKIEGSLDIPDEQVKQGDDFAARVYVLFPFDPGRANLMRRLRHRLGKRLFGAGLPGAALNYVWASRLPAGTRWDNPFAAESKMISVGHGPLPEWQAVEVDVRGDLEHFGLPPQAPAAVAVMSDSDNSCQEAVSWFADFRFLGEASAGETAGGPSRGNP